MSDKELLDLLGEDDELENNDDSQDNDLTELKQLVEDLKRENQGLLQAKQDEKRKRQENQRRLESIETTVNKILETRQKPADADKNAEPNIKGIPVKFTEDGEAFIPNDVLNELLLKPQQQTLNKLEEKLDATRNQSEAAKRADQIIREVLSEDERFPAVYNNYVKARNWIENKVIDYQKDNNLRGPMTSAQALDVVFDDTLENEFKENFPNMDLHATIIAEDSQKLFRKMLKTHAESGQEDPVIKKEDKDRFSKVLKKPSSLGGLHNAKPSDLTIVDKLSDLSQDDIMGLSDKEIRALEKALREEEMRG